jgi:unsaturated chondroitin disaccharide hydrolase
VTRIAGRPHRSCVGCAREQPDRQDLRGERLDGPALSQSHEGIDARGSVSRAAKGTELPGLAESHPPENIRRVPPNRGRTADPDGLVVPRQTEAVAADTRSGRPVIDLSTPVSLPSLSPRLDRLWELSAAKLRAIESEYDSRQGAPVFTIEGKYATRGWTEWTQGFQFGSTILQFDATDERAFHELGRARTLERMTPHVTHFGVHDHGFNNVSTYGNLLRLMLEGRTERNRWEQATYEMALKASSAVQANRWTSLPDGAGYIYSFNGPHSLFADTIRSCRSLAVGHRLGHAISGENDRVVSLLHRLVSHAETTARFNIYFGEGRDHYDVRGRVAHESVFNVNDGEYRCPSSQQGYSPFTTWTRGLAWIMCGYAEELEFLRTCSDEELDPLGGRGVIEAMMLQAATASCDFYIENSPTCGIPYWDTGAPELHRLGDYLGAPADPFNDVEPVDSSAAAIGAQGLLRLGRYLRDRGDTNGERYWTAGLKVADTLLEEPYLSTNPAHHGLLLHVVYHWPRGWDHVPAGRRVPVGESAMWGDYHLRELALYLQRILRDEPYLTFWGDIGGSG